MLTKLLLLLIILFVALSVVVWLLKRLTQTSQRLAELHSELLRNDEVLASKIAVLEEQKAQMDMQQQQMSENDSSDSGVLEADVVDGGLIEKAVPEASVKQKDEHSREGRGV
jgi:hypothetical protein